MANDRLTLGQRHYSYWQGKLDEDASYVYVIRGGKKTPIKIGVAKRPIQRLKTLQTGNHQQLRLLLVVPGDEKLETVLHHRFAEHRLEGSEWFYGQGVAGIIEFVNDLALYMVRGHDGSVNPPLLHYFEGWTEAERYEFPRRRPRAAITFPEPPSATAAADSSLPDRSFVPTLADQVRRTRIGPRQRNRRMCAQ